MTKTSSSVLSHLRETGEALSATEVAEDLGWPRWRARNALVTLRGHGLVRPAMPGNGGNVPTRWSAA